MPLGMVLAIRPGNLLSGPAQLLQDLKLDPYRATFVCWHMPCLRCLILGTTYPSTQAYHTSLVLGNLTDNRCPGSADLTRLAQYFDVSQGPCVHARTLGSCTIPSPTRPKRRL